MILARGNEKIKERTQQVSHIVFVLYLNVRQMLLVSHVLYNSHIIVILNNLIGNNNNDNTNNANDNNNVCNYNYYNTR